MKHEQCWMKQCENTCAPVSRFFVFKWNYMKNSVHLNRKSTLFCCFLLLRRGNRIGCEVNIYSFVRSEWKIAIISVILFTVLPTQRSIRRKNTSKNKKYLFRSILQRKRVYWEEKFNFLKHFSLNFRNSNEKEKKNKKFKIN